jgi:hypothetical protein
LLLLVSCPVKAGRGSFWVALGAIGVPAAGAPTLATPGEAAVAKAGPGEKAPLYRGLWGSAAGAATLGNSAVKKAGLGRADDKAPLYRKLWGSGAAATAVLGKSAITGSDRADEKASLCGLFREEDNRFVACACSACLRAALRLKNDNKK